MKLTRKGYVVASGYMGYVEDLNKYLLFPTEEEYNEWIAEKENVWDKDNEEDN